MALNFPELNETLNLGPGEGVLIWPDTAFRGHAIGAKALASIQHFRVATGDTEPFRKLQKQRDGFTPSAATDPAWLARCVERLQSGEGAARNWLLAVILAEGGFLRSVSGEPDGRGRLDLAALKSWILAHLVENPGVPELAKRVALSPSRFRTVFLEQEDISAGQFILDVRAAEARRLIAETQEPLKAIAARLGHADVVVFHRAFKRDTGTTPARYRRDHRIRG